jgi:uncharacterized protein involved in exopolysaccharide biosynthesis
MPQDLIKEIFIKNRRLYLYLVLATIIVSAFISLQLKNEYTSEAFLVSPRSSLSSGGGQSASSGSSSIASIIPFFNSSNADPNIEYAIHTVMSYSFLSKFIVENDLLPVLLGFRSYNSSTNKINYKNNADDLKVSNFFKEREVDLEIKEIQDAVKILRKKFTIYTDVESSLVTARFTYYSPNLAKNILHDLLMDLNKTIASKDILSAERNVEFLADKINSYPQSVITKTLGAVLESNITKMALAQSDSEYAFTMIDAPIIPLKKSWPSRTFIVLSSFLSMLLLIIISIFMEMQIRLFYAAPKK